MNGKQLKNSILQWAIQGKLVPQDPNDEPASVLLDKIRQEKERLIKEKKIKRDKNASIIYRGEDNSYYEKMLATGEVKCIDEEVPFEIPQGWEWERFGNIMINKDSERVPLSVAQRQQLKKTYDYYGASGVIDKVDKYLFDKDLLLIGEDGANLINRSTPIAFIAKGKYWVNNHAHVLDVCSGMALSYVALFINAISLVDYVTGTAQPKMNQEKMNSILLAIPPVKEQHRILEKMSMVDAFVDKYASLQTKLDSLDNSVYELLRKSILQEAIQGKLVPQNAEEGTAQELLEQIEMEKRKLVKEGRLKKSALTTSVIFRGDDNKYYELIDNSPVCIDEFLPFQIPETWAWCKVKDLLEIQTGASFKKEQVNANKKGIRILRGGNILPNKYIFKNDDVFVSDEFVNTNTLLKKNCIITPAVTSLENIGKMAVIEKDYNNVSAGGFVFIFSPYIQDFNHSLLLAYFLQSPFLIEAMRGITKKSGAAFYNLGKERLKELYLPLPPMAEQSRVVAKIKEVLSSIMSR